MIVCLMLLIKAAHLFCHVRIEYLKSFIHGTSKNYPYKKIKTGYGYSVVLRIGLSEIHTSKQTIGLLWGKL